MKKIIAFVLTVAMVLSVCAFSVSAETAAPSIELQGAANAVAGETYEVSVRLNDAAGVVAGGNPCKVIRKISPEDDRKYMP